MGGESRAVKERNIKGHWAFIDGLFRWSIHFLFNCFWGKGCSNLMRRRGKADFLFCSDYSSKYSFYSHFGNHFSPPTCWKTGGEYVQNCERVLFYYVQIWWFIYGGGEYIFGDLLGIFVDLLVIAAGGWYKFIYSMRFWVINGLCWLVIMILCTHSHLRIAGANSRKLDFGFGNSQKCTEMDEKNSPEREIWWFWWGNWVDNGAGLEEKKALSIYQRGAKMNGKSGLKSWKNKSIWK